MKIYLYDGTFEGMLTCIYEGYYSVEPDGILDSDKYKPTLFDDSCFIVTDSAKANKVAFSIIDKLSEEFFHKILNAFFSEDYNVATYIYRLVKYAFKSSPEVIMNAANETVANVVGLYTSVVRETHLFVGLVRFSKLKGDIYYCQFAPTYNQVPLLAEHFSERMGSEMWVIHDVKRNIAVFYDKTEWYINEFYGNENFELSEDEELFRNLWKEFHSKIAIKERINPKLQRSFMPKKYWKYLLEMNQ